MPARQPAKSSEAQHRNEHKPQILLVDDEPLNLDVLEQELSGLDLLIHTAKDGREALDQIATSPPDMIFLDLMMPVLDGFGVLDALQANSAWREIPVIIISAANDLQNIVRGIEMGAMDFLPKPFEPALLKARLRAGLEKKRLRDMEQLYTNSLERELEIGREIQAGFLPKVIPQPQGWKIKAHFQAAREVAGDFYDVFEIGPTKMGFMLGDVTDKGVGSALYMALYRTILRSSMLSDSFAQDPNAADCATPEDCVLQAIQLANRYICTLHDSAMLASVFFAVLDTHSGQLCYVNAGHDPPCLLRQNKIAQQIQSTGPLVGAIEDAVYTIETLRLAPGDTLVMFSDGIPDAQDVRGERFGIERFHAILKGPKTSSADLFRAVLPALEKHMEGTPQFDDITLVIVSRK